MERGNGGQKENEGVSEANASKKCHKPEEEKREGESSIWCAGLWQMRGVLCVGGKGAAACGRPHGQPRPPLWGGTERRRQSIAGLGRGALCRAAQAHRPHVCVGGVVMKQGGGLSSRWSGHASMQAGRPAAGGNGGWGGMGGAAAVCSLPAPLYVGEGRGNGALRRGWSAAAQPARPKRGGGRRGATMGIGGAALPGAALESANGQAERGKEGGLPDR